MEGFVGLHVGAGSHSHKLQSQYKRLCRRASKEGTLLLKQGKSAMEVAESVTAILENSPLTNAGFGSTLTWDGKVECDASIMDGASLKWGGVGAVPGVKNPISLARALCERQGADLSLGRVPPCLLVGFGAKKWAKEAGVVTKASNKLISERSLKMYQKYKRKVKIFEEAIGKSITPLDTVGVVCLDKSGNVAASCSSGGIALKHSGRVGQAAIYGAGVWAENGKEMSIAVCSSGCGEYIIKTMLAKEVSDALKSAPCPISALHSSLKTRFLDSSYLNGITERLGGVAVLRVNEGGLGEFLWGHTTSTMCLGFMCTSDSSPKSRLSCLPRGQTPGLNVVIEGTSFKTRSHLNEDFDDSISTPVEEFEVRSLSIAMIFSRFTSRNVPIKSGCLSVKPYEENSSFTEFSDPNFVLGSDKFWLRKLFAFELCVHNLVVFFSTPTNISGKGSETKMKVFFGTKGGKPSKGAQEQYGPGSRGFCLLKHCASRKSERAWVLWSGKVKAWNQTEGREQID